MGRLFDKIRTAVSDGRYLVGEHAGERLDERQVPDWQVIASIADGRLLAERPRSRPNPSVEVEQSLPDGTAVKVVWSWLRENKAAKLMTVHYFDQ